LVSPHTTFFGFDVGIILDITDMKAYMEMKGYLCPHALLYDAIPDHLIALTWAILEPEVRHVLS